MRLLNWVLSLTFLLLFFSLANGYETVAVKNGATLKGTVVFTGTIPPQGKISIDRDVDYCGKELKTDKFIISDHRVKNVVVWIEGIGKGKAVPKKDVPIIIKKCRVEPLVNIGFVGGNFLLRNDDDILHTLQLKLWLEYQRHVSARPLKYGATIYNVALPVKGLEVRKPIKRYHRFSKDTGVIRITSNTHTWIRGYIFVFDHPYAAVTDEKGTFVITDLPPGEYTLKIWHEGFGLKEKRISVKPGETKEIEIDLKDLKKAETAASPSVRFLATRYDFGTIKKGESVTHEFALLNKGKGTLRIVELIPA